MSASEWLVQRDKVLIKDMRSGPLCIAVFSKSAVVFFAIETSRLASTTVPPTAIQFSGGLENFSAVFFDELFCPH